ncbi:MAG: hypothetical protein ACRD2O_16685 [Terriglobia bacterium]
MKRHMKGILSLTTLLMQLMAVIPLGAAPLPVNANWNSLKQLAPGDEVKIAMKNMKSYKGKFQSVGDEAIVVRLGKRSQSFARQDVLRVSTKGKSHRLRNTLIGAAIGAGAGLGFGQWVDGTAGCGFICFASSDAGKEIFTPSFAVVGAIVGAVLPARGWRWRDLYRAP